MARHRVTAWFVGAATIAQPSRQAVARPPILGIAHVRLQTSDLRKARTFYGGLLGYGEVPQASPAVAIFRVNNRQRIIVRAGLPPDRDERLVDLAFETTDPSAARAFLLAHGIDARDAE